MWKTKIIRESRGLCTTPFPTKTSINVISKNNRPCKLEITSDVPYSASSSRNLLDIYNISSHDRVNDSTKPAILFVHGGMWQRGDKNRNVLSAYDILKNVITNQIEDSVEERRAYRALSNVGKTLAKAGGRAYIMNYRLPNPSAAVVSHLDQVQDVADAINFVVKREREFCSDPRIYIGGHSAGAHLAALALCHRQYLITGHHYFKGFFGISGIYNLSRLRMNALSDVALTPVFGTDDEVIFDASPVHVLLQMSATKLPFLSKIPILLLNSHSNDFHLSQDAKELIVALDRLLPSVNRKHVLIQHRNHFSILREFGANCDNLLPYEEQQDQREENGHMSSLIWNHLSSTFSSYFDDNRGDETAVHLLSFLGLDQQSQPSK